MSNSKEEYSKAVKLLSDTMLKIDESIYDESYVFDGGDIMALHDFAHKCFALAMYGEQLMKEEDE